MLGLMKTLRDHKLLKIKTKTVHTDNFIFKCHYRITVAVLMIGVILLYSKEYIGENISCLVANQLGKDLKRVIERFCYFMSTFTVSRHYNRSMHNMEVAHPGVGPYVPKLDENDIIRHNYYQWVPFLLFFQGVCFYIPHIIWKKMDNKTLENMVKSLSDIKVVCDYEQRSIRYTSIIKQLKDNIKLNENWSLGLFYCECLNLLNLIFQVWITDAFLNKMFMDLGVKVYWDVKGDEFNPLDVVFPKVTKCSFTRFGPSGSIINHDFMCIMAQNIINEKIFVFLWYWYIILFILTVILLIWRIVSFLLRRIVSFNIFVNYINSMEAVDKLTLYRIVRNVSYGEWIFLTYLCSNLCPKYFNELLTYLADSYESTEAPLKQSEQEENLVSENEKPLVDF